MPGKPATPKKLSPAAQKKYDEAAKRGKAAEEKAAAAEKPKKPANPASTVPPKPLAKPAETAPAETDPPKSQAERLGLPPTSSAEDAWAACHKNKKADVTETQLAELWVEVSEELCGEDAIGENWATVRDIVLEKTA